MYGRPLNVVRIFYNRNTASVGASRDMGECFDIHVGVGQGWVISPWLFKVFMDGALCEMRAK